MMIRLVYVSKSLITVVTAIQTGRQWFPPKKKINFGKMIDMITNEATVVSWPLTFESFLYREAGRLPKGFGIHLFVFLSWSLCKRD